MSVLRKKIVIILSFLSVSLIFLESPATSETTFSERTLTGDILIKETYQPGSGLPVGKIQSVRGEAIVFHRDPTVGYRIQSGLPVYVGDILHTRGTAWILCRLIDGSSIVLTPETTLTIIQSSYNSTLKTSVSFLYLKKGSARFKMNPLPDLSSHDLKVQTEVAFASTREADFVVKANPASTDIIAFGQSRLEVTGMAQSEETAFITDFQRAIIASEIITPMVETLSRDDIETMMVYFDTAPKLTLLATDTTNNNQDNDIEETLVEEDLVED